MVNKRCCCISFGSVLLLLGAALIVILGGVLKPVVNAAIKKGVKDGLTIDYAHYNEKDRDDFILNMKNYDYYFFNVTNVAQIRGNLESFFLPSTPVLPHVAQLGPYSYRYYEYKTNIHYDVSPTGDELITYNIWWFKNPITGNTDNVDQVCTVNPLYMGGLRTAWQTSFYPADGVFGGIVRGQGYDENALERQLFAGFVPQIPAQVMPPIIAGMTAQFVSMASHFFPFYVGAAFTTAATVLGGAANALTAWRTHNASNALTYPLANFEIGVPTNYHPGAAVTAHLFNQAANDYSFLNVTGVTNLLTLLGQLGVGNTSGVPAFATAYGPDFIADGVAPAGIAAETTLLLTAIGGWVNNLTTSVSTTSTTANNDYTFFTFNGINGFGFTDAGSWSSWSDMAYAQIGSTLVSTLAGLPSYLSLIGYFQQYSIPNPGPIHTPIDPTNPLLQAVPAGFYGTNPYQITYNGLELPGAGFTLSSTQTKAFFNRLASNGTSIYAALLGVGLGGANNLTVVELATLNALLPYFTWDATVNSRRNAFALHDYLASTVTTFLVPGLLAANSGLLTCRVVDTFINKGYFDPYLQATFPGYFSDNNANYTGSLRTFYTGKGNADLARMIYSRENHTSILKITDTGADAASYCPKDLATGQPLCQDLWTPKYGDAGYRVTLSGYSDFTFFGPFQESDDPPRKLQAYSSDLIRVANLTYEADETIKGLKTRRYGLAQESLNNQVVNPVNANYRMTLTGVAPMKFASPLWGFTLSRPHFYGAPTTVINSVSGLNTTGQAPYDTHLWLEPLTGAAVQGTKKLQGSYRMHPFTFDERASQRLFVTLTDIYWPSFWADEYASLNDSQASDLSKVFDLRDKIAMLSPIGYGVGAGVFALGLALIFYGCKSAAAGGATQLKSSTTL